MPAPTRAPADDEPEYATPDRASDCVVYASLDQLGDTPEAESTAPPSLPSRAYKAKTTGTTSKAVWIVRHTTFPPLHSGHLCVANQHHFWRFFFTGTTQRMYLLHHGTFHNFEDSFLQNRSPHKRLAHMHPSPRNRRTMGAHLCTLFSTIHTQRSRSRTLRLVPPCT